MSVCWLLLPRDTQQTASTAQKVKDTALYLICSYTPSTFLKHDRFLIFLPRVFVFHITASPLKPPIPLAAVRAAK